MYDTVHLWFSFDTLSSPPSLEAIAQKLSNISINSQVEREEVSYYGQLGNLRVAVFSTGVSVQGSLSKYCLEDNFGVPYLDDIKHAFERLSAYLGLPMHNAKVNRLDIAQNFIMKYPPALYYAYLGNNRYYHRLEQNNGLYYRNSNRTLMLYGKVQEQKNKGKPIPLLYREKNILRIEMRHTRRLPYLLALQEVTGASLLDPSFLNLIVAMWRDTYLSIDKRHVLDFDIHAFGSVKEFESFLMLKGVEALGGAQAVLQLIEEKRLQRRFDNAMQPNRLKHKVKNLAKTPSLTTYSDLITELDKKVLDAAKLYL